MSQPTLLHQHCTLPTSAWRPVTFPAQLDVPLIEENQLSFAAAAGSLAFHLLQLTDLAAASLILHGDTHQEFTKPPLGPAGGIPLCPAKTRRAEP